MVVTFTRLYYLPISTLFSAHKFWLISQLLVAHCDTLAHDLYYLLILWKDQQPKNVVKLERTWNPDYAYCNSFKFFMCSDDIGLVN